MKIIISILFTASLFACGLGCGDTKTGLHRSSLSLHESRENKVFKFALESNMSKIALENGQVFEIKDSWVEYGWTNECVDNHIVVQKDNFLQIVVDANCGGEGDIGECSLWKLDSTSGVSTDSYVSFEYHDEDTFSLNLCYNEKTIETLKFYKKVSH